MLANFKWVEVLDLMIGRISSGQIFFGVRIMCFQLLKMYEAAERRSCRQNDDKF